MLFYCHPPVLDIQVISHSPMATLSRTQSINQSYGNTYGIKSTLCVWVHLVCPDKLNPINHLPGVSWCVSSYLMMRIFGWSCTFQYAAVNSNKSLPPLVLFLKRSKNSSQVTMDNRKKTPVNLSRMNEWMNEWINEWMNEWTVFVTIMIKRYSNAILVDQKWNVKQKCIVYLPYQAALNELYFIFTVLMKCGIWD